MKSRIAPAIAAIDEFGRAFDSKPSILVRAPGRINLIGEHTDYNAGFVLPMAIERAVWIALRPRTDRKLRLRSHCFDDTVTFDVDATFDLPTCERFGESGRGDWRDRALGVVHICRKDGLPIVGFDGVIASDLPIGAGLASSAAFEIAIGRALVAAGGSEWIPLEMAERAHRVENDWVGLRCGMMDPLIVAAAVAESALLIDCRSLDLSTAPLPPGGEIVVLDTGTRRRLTSSLYNERRQRCEAAAAALAVESLRDVMLPDLERAHRRGRIDRETFRRARHVVTENERTLLAVETMAEGNLRNWGDLIDASHRSLRDDFEVSSAELDLMVDLARDDERCFGARLIGAGFAGCAIALVDACEDLDQYCARVREEYEARTGRAADVFTTGATAGAMEIDVGRFV